MAAGTATGDTAATGATEATEATDAAGGGGVVVAEGNFNRASSPHDLQQHQLPSRARAPSLQREDSGGIAFNGSGDAADGGGSTTYSADPHLPPLKRTNSGVEQQQHAVPHKEKKSVTLVLISMFLLYCDMDGCVLRSISPDSFSTDSIHFSWFSLTD